MTGLKFFPFKIDMGSFEMHCWIKQKKKEIWHCKSERLCIPLKEGDMVP